MLLTDNASIQEVIFFPQMRPEKKEVVSTDADYEAAGVPSTWIPALRKMGFTTVAALKAANPNKVFNDLGGLRKKLKIDAPMPKKEEVEGWIS